MDYTATTGSRGPTAPALGPVTRLSPGVSPVGSPAPQPSMGNVILASVLGPHPLGSRIATGHTSGARLSTPHASATLELPGRRRLQSHAGLIVPLLQSPLTPVVVNPSPQWAPVPCVRPGFTRAPCYGYLGHQGSERRRGKGRGCGRALACYRDPRGRAWARQSSPA